MYRYQATPQEFGNNPWFCQRCADFTMRRVIPQDLERVPAEDCPESWGRREVWLAEIRALRLRERDGLQQPAMGAPMHDDASLGARFAYVVRNYAVPIAVLAIIFYWD